MIDKRWILMCSLAPFKDGELYYLATMDGVLGLYEFNGYEFRGSEGYIKFDEQRFLVFDSNHDRDRYYYIKHEWPEFKP